jgi:large subunit ribosomal protein L4
MWFTGHWFANWPMHAKEPYPPKPDRKSEGAVANLGGKRELGAPERVLILWRGGGVIFGPKPRDYSLKMNRKERRLALRTALQSRVADLVVVQAFASQLERPKTKEVLQALTRWGVAPESKVLMITAAREETVWLSVRNVERIRLISATNLNVFDILAADQIVATAEAIAKIQEVYGED